MRLLRSLSSWRCAIALLALAAPPALAQGFPQNLPQPPLPPGPFLEAGSIRASTAGVPAGQWPNFLTPPNHPFQASPTNRFAPLPGTRTELEVALGKALFWDEQLSRDNTVSCGTCHSIAGGGTDGRPLAFATNNGRGSHGVIPQDNGGSYSSTAPAPAFNDERRATGVIAPSMIGAPAFAKRQFWDGRANEVFTDLTGAVIPGFATNASLEMQAVLPPQDSSEMGHDATVWSQVNGKLNSARILDLATLSTVPPELAPFVAAGFTYGAAFDIVYGGDPQFGGAIGVTRERAGLAIAHYERTLIPNQAPFDTGPTTGAALNGFNIMVFSACFGCHAAATGTPVLNPTGGFVNPLDQFMTDQQRHFNIGFPSAPGATGAALGSFGVKTPTLRNITLHTNFGHNGRLVGVAQMLQFYNRQFPGATPVFPLRDPATGGILTPAQLSDVQAFLTSLVDPRVAAALPPFDRPDLYAERVPHQSNEPAAYPGTPAVVNGPVPNIIANVPLQDNDAQFKLGVRNAPASSAFGVLGVAGPLPVPPPAGPIKLDPATLTTFVVPTNATGQATFPFGLIAGLPSGVFSAQWAVLDPVSGNFAFSNAAQVVVQ
jgi:cytochrome c peroxidase